MQDSVAPGRCFIIVHCAELLALVICSGTQKICILVLKPSACRVFQICTFIIRFFNIILQHN